jgi:hypothetical protein
VQSQRGWPSEDQTMAVNAGMAECEDQDCRFCRSHDRVKHAIDHIMGKCYHIPVRALASNNDGTTNATPFCGSENRIEASLQNSVSLPASSRICASIYLLDGNFMHRAYSEHPSRSPGRSSSSTSEREWYGPNGFSRHRIGLNEETTYVIS